MSQAMRVLKLRASSRRLGQCGDGLLVGRIDSLQAANPLESAIRGEDGIDAAVDGQGGEDGVAGVELWMGLEEVDSTLNVVWLDRVPPGLASPLACAYLKQQVCTYMLRSHHPRRVLRACPRPLYQRSRWRSASRVA